MGLNWIFKRHRRIGFGEYGHKVHEFDLPRDGQVQFARWLHPFETPKDILQSDIDALRQFIAPGDFVIDIGAHTGDTTVPMALAAGPAGCTLALEPNPYVFKVLAANAELNRGKVNIQPRCYAATAEDGQFVFHYTDASFANGGFKTEQKWPLFRRRYPLQVEGRNLLRILRTEFAQWLPKLSYVKVDAEGYDQKILQSLLPILDVARPVVRSEVFRKMVRSERHALFDLFARLDYGVYRYEYGPATKGRKLERTDMTREKHFDILAIPSEQQSRAAA